MSTITQATIQQFLSARRIAVVGVSRNSRDYSRALFRALCERGYEVIPVHPVADQVEGIACFRSVKDIEPAPDRVMILLPEHLTEQAVIDCGEAGVKHVWLHRRVGTGVADTRAVFRAEEHGIQLITGLCLFMFLPRTGLIHRCHGFALKCMGAYPA